MIRQSLAPVSPAPKLTDAGCQRTVLDDALFQEIQQFYRANRPSPEPGNEYLTSVSPGGLACTLTQLPAALMSKLHTSVQPIAEEWVGRKIVPTYVYGIRTYLRGAVLKTHRDRQTTHVVSAILNVDQRADIAWPLLLEGEANQANAWRQVVLAPGELFLYEGARLNHGRPAAFRGEFFANVFIHFALA